MPPKASATKAKAAASDHASYQGKLESYPQHIAMRSRIVFLGRIHCVQLRIAVNFNLEHELTRFTDMITDAIINLKDVCLLPSQSRFSY
jgi:hypothetical protein